MSELTDLRVERPPKTLRELTLEKMRTAILSFHFKPGERLVERTLCDMLGVSRTVVREVIRHLESEGLVELVPYQGPIVARPDLTKVVQIYELRSILEGIAARSSAEKATKQDIAALQRSLEAIDADYKSGDPRRVLASTMQFYETLFLSAEKRVAWEMLKALNARINHLRAMTISFEGRSTDGTAELRAIVDAIRAHDPDAAEKASQHHVATAARLAAEFVARQQQ